MKMKIGHRAHFFWVATLLIGLLGCDPVYSVKIVIQSTNKEPLSGVEYKIETLRGKSMLVCKTGKTSTDGVIQYQTVGIPEIAIELRKFGYESVSKKLTMENNLKPTMQVIYLEPVAGSPP
jgi:hypothetical protein